MSSKLSAGGPQVLVDQEISGSISLGLHQATQPLTILQGTLELALLNASTVKEYRNAIERSLEELQRVTECFEQLRTITQLHQRVSDVTTFAVSPMVKTVLTSLKGPSVTAGVEVILQSKIGDSKDSSGGRVRLSLSRVSSALRMAISELLPLLERGSKVVVVVEARPQDVVIRANDSGKVRQSAQLTDTVPKPMTPRQKLAQDLAASAGGELTFVSKGIFVRLPKEPSASLGGEMESENGEVAHV